MQAGLSSYDIDKLLEPLTQDIITIIIEKDVPNDEQ
jgi:hypothetical protein